MDTTDQGTYGPDNKEALGQCHSPKGWIGSSHAGAHPIIDGGAEVCCNGVWCLVTLPALGAALGLTSGT
jgi:hypothetical protein